MACRLHICTLEVASFLLRTAAGMLSLEFNLEWDATMDVSRYDARNYRTVSVRDGYGEWAATYEDPVLDLLDLRLLERLESVPWERQRRAADLACGTGRIGVWLRQRGLIEIDGIDLTPEMLDRAREKGAYASLSLSDIGATSFPSDAYDLTTAVLVDEHLADLAPMYREAARITRPGGYFVLVGYHPFFLINGIPTHFDSASGEPLAIECYVHLFSDHVRCRAGGGLATARDGGGTYRRYMVGAQT